MTAQPDLAEFSAAYEAGQPQVVWTSLVADLETPVSAMLKLAEGRPYSCLLESVEGGAVRGRYSAIGLKPDLIWRCFGARAEVNRQARQDLAAFEPCPGHALDELRGLIEQTRIALPEGLPPMAAGLFGYLGYDMVRLMERLPDANPDPLGIPDAVLMRPTVMAIFDNIEDRVVIVTPVWPGAGLEARAAYDLARERLADVVADFDRGLPHRSDWHRAGMLPEPTSNVTRARYHEMVEAAKAYIRAGDIFQVVPSQRFALPFNLPPFALYRALRRLNPSPFLFFLDFDGFALVGSSPEILVRLRDGTVVVRPIAGTRRRGATRAEDSELAKDMLSDPKELAEHLMLLDLGRNDVGRVAEIGTRAGDRKNGGRVLQPRHAHGVQRRGSDSSGQRRARCPGRRFPRRHRERRAEGARHGDHRRARAGAAQLLRRGGRLFRRRWQHGHLHRAAHRSAQGRTDVRAGRGRRGR